MMRASACPKIAGRIWRLVREGLISLDTCAAEASFLRDYVIIFGAGVSAEACGRDTLESVRLCDAILRRRGDFGRIVCCTSTYHQPRCALLFRLLGYRVLLPRMPNGWGRLSAMKYARTVLKEILATPYD